MMMRRKERRHKVAEREGKKQKQGGQNENEQRDEIYDRFMTPIYLPYPNQPTNQNPGRVYLIVREEEEFQKEKFKCNLYLDDS